MWDIANSSKSNRCCEKTLKRLTIKLYCATATRNDNFSVFAYVNRWIRRNLEQCFPNWGTQSPKGHFNVSGVLWEEYTITEYCLTCCYISHCTMLICVFVKLYLSISPGAQESRGHSVGTSYVEMSLTICGTLTYRMALFKEKSKGCARKSSLTQTNGGGGVSVRANSIVAQEIRPLIRYEVNSNTESHKNLKKWRYGKRPKCKKNKFLTGWLDDLTSVKSLWIGSSLTAVELLYARLLVDSLLGAFVY